jgi:hypothetical protein
MKELIKALAQFIASNVVVLFLVGSACMMSFHLFLGMKHICDSETSAVLKLEKNPAADLTSEMQELKKAQTELKEAAKWATPVIPLE